METAQKDKKALLASVRRALAAPGAPKKTFFLSPVHRNPEEKQRRAAVAAASVAAAVALAAITALGESMVPRFECTVCDTYTPHGTCCMCHASACGGQVPVLGGPARDVLRVLEV